jgi:PleD family two-component response regulator
MQFAERLRRLAAIAHSQLYQAKRSGRNQIVLARHDDPTEMPEAAE